VTSRQTIVRGRLAAPIACCLIGCLLAPLLPGSAATAESGISAGSEAVITAGAPLAVRSAPGWDAAVSYEIADGSFVTVWDSEQVAPDGSLWYPVDGGFVPVDAVSSVALLKGGVTLQQDAVTGEWVEPASVGAVGADLTATDPESAAASTSESVEPAATDAATDTASKEILTDATSSADLAQDALTDPAPVDPASAAPVADPATGEWIDPTTVKAVEPAPVDAAPGDLAAPVEAAPVEPSLPSGTEPPGQPIATAYIAGTGGDGAPCLAAPQWGAETLAVLAEGQPVEVRAETIGEWQPVNCAGAGGYVHVALIAWTPVGSSDPATAGGEQPEGKTGSGGDAVGEQIVSFALQFQGYPYIYAGEGPYAFDCSGFTMFVIHNTLGINIPHDMFVQYQLGRPVSRDELQPGDLVFFQNTFRPGMSHDGIYIGGGQFIHAETESSGVRISDLDSDYYSSRWYGAVRFS
jgi:cell wall-associated NlpC family hydrolase